MVLKYTLGKVVFMYAISFDNNDQLGFRVDFQLIEWVACRAPWPFAAHVPPYHPTAAPPPSRRRLSNPSVACSRVPLQRIGHNSVGQVSVQRYFRRLTLARPSGRRRIVHENLQPLAGRAQAGTGA